MCRTPCVRQGLAVDKQGEAAQGGAVLPEQLWGVPVLCPEFWGAALPGLQKLPGDIPMDCWMQGQLLAGAGASQPDRIPAHQAKYL